MKKKILILVNSLSFFISHRKEIAYAARNRGFRVIIVYGELGCKNTTFLSEKGIEFFHVPLERKSLNPIKEFRSLFVILKTFYKLKPDIVHLITIKAYIYGGIAARLTRVPCVVSAVAGLGILSNQKRFKNIVIQKILYLLFYFSFNHHNQKIIVQNIDDKNKLINWIGLDKNKILLFRGSGIDLSLFKNLDETNNITTVCFASRLLRDKGVFDYVSAARIIKKRGIRVKFILAGNLDTSNPSSLTNQELNLIKKEKIVEVLGFYKDIPKLFAKSHIVCLPSFYGEGLPKVLLEAAAASRAVVTTDSPGCRDAIIPNKTGLLVPINNSQKLADALQRLIENNAERVSMGKAGRNLAKQEFQVEKIVEKHLNIFERLLAN